MSFPKCNKADTDWYVMTLTDPPLVWPKGEKPFELFEEEDAIQEPTFIMIVRLHIEVGLYVWWNTSNTMLVSQIQNEAV